MTGRSELRRRRPCRARARSSRGQRRQRPAGCRHAGPRSHLRAAAGRPLATGPALTT